MKQYIGDGVYMEVNDPFQIILTTATNRIVLEPWMLNAIEILYSKAAAEIVGKAVEDGKKEGTA